MQPIHPNPVLRTVLLWHDIAAGPHHDWLLEDPARPGDPQAPLITFRVLPHTRDWPVSGQFDLTPLPPHRHIYLTYQGPVSGNRGTVTRVAEGTFEVLFWSTDAIRIKVRWSDGVAGCYELTRVDDARWVGRVIG